MAALAAFGRRYVPGWLPGRTDPTGLCVAAVALVRGSGEHTVYMTSFAFNQAVRAFESEPRGEVIKRRSRFRACRFEWQQQHERRAEHRKEQR